jgi:hypothetical protein
VAIFRLASAKRGLSGRYDARLDGWYKRLATYPLDTGQRYPLDTPLLLYRNIDVGAQAGRQDSHAHADRTSY